MLNNAKARAKKQGIPFNLTEADIHIPETCPVLGIPLDRSGREHTPSLDKLVPSLGYVKNNVLVVSMRANRWKDCMSLADMQRLTSFYENELRKRGLVGASNSQTPYTKSRQTKKKEKP